MGMSPTKINWMRQRDFIPVWSMQGHVADAGVGVGAPDLAEVAAIGLVGCLMVDSDDLQHIMVIPTNWARNQPIYVRGVWEHAASTGTKTITWKFLYQLVTPDSTALAKPATALDTAIVADTAITTAQTCQRTAAGIINAGTIGDNVLYMHWLMERDASTGTFSDAVHLLGVEFEYTPRFGQGKPAPEARGWSASEK